ncbi:MAG TPA: hypothetical protein VFE65_18925 [Pseudonocardia sp.]|nr:hypothetical protein [Pseudonocardia sp.]
MARQRSPNLREGTGANAVQQLLVPTATLEERARRQSLGSQVVDHAQLHLIDQRLVGLGDPAVIGELHQGEVELAVRDEQAELVERPGGLPHVDHDLVERRQVVVGQRRHRHLEREQLEPGAQTVNLVDVPGPEFHDPVPVPRALLQDTAHREHAQGLAQRRATDAQPFAQPRLDEPLPRQELAGEDQRPDLLIGQEDQAVLNQHASVNPLGCIGVP